MPNSRYKYCLRAGLIDKMTAQEYNSFVSTQIFTALFGTSTDTKGRLTFMKRNKTIALVLVIVLAAAEAAVALAIFLNFYNNHATIDVDEANELKG